MAVKCRRSHAREPQFVPQTSERRGRVSGAPGLVAVEFVREDEGVVGERRATSAGELLPADPMLREKLERPGVETDAPSGVGLGVLLDDLAADLDERAGDDELAVVEVDVLPAQGAQLAPAGSGSRCESEIEREGGVDGAGAFDQQDHRLG